MQFAFLHLVVINMVAPEALFFFAAITNPNTIHDQPTTLHRNIYVGGRFSVTSL